LLKINKIVHNYSKADG